MGIFHGSFAQSTRPLYATVCTAPSTAPCTEHRVQFPYSWAREPAYRHPARLRRPGIPQHTKEISIKFQRNHKSAGLAKWPVCQGQVAAGPGKLAGIRLGIVKNPTHLPPNQSLLPAPPSDTFCPKGGAASQGIHLWKHQRSLLHVWPAEQTRLHRLFLLHNSFPFPGLLGSFLLSSRICLFVSLLSTLSSHSSPLPVSLYLSSRSFMSSSSPLWSS